MKSKKIRILKFSQKEKKKKKKNQAQMLSLVSSTKYIQGHNTNPSGTFKEKAEGTLLNSFGEVSITVPNPKTSQEKKTSDQ